MLDPKEDSTQDDDGEEEDYDYLTDATEEDSGGDRVLTWLDSSDNTEEGED